MNNSNNHIYIPYKIGFGKTGEAKTGIKHAMIISDNGFNNSFDTYKMACLANKNDMQCPKQFLSICNKYFLFDQLPNRESEVNEFLLPDGTNLVFYNLEKIKNRMKGALSVTIGEHKLNLI